MNKVLYNIFKNQKFYQIILEKLAQKYFKRL